MRVVDYCVNYVCGILNRSKTISRRLWKTIVPNDNRSSEINNFFCVHNISFILCSFGSSHNLSHTYPPRVWFGTEA